MVIRNVRFEAENVPVTLIGMLASKYFSHVNWRLVLINRNSFWLYKFTICYSFNAISIAHFYYEYKIVSLYLPQALQPLSYYKIMSNKNIIFQVLRIVFRISRDYIDEYVCTESYHSYPCVLLLRPDVILIFFFDTIHVNCVRLSVWSL